MSASASLAGLGVASPSTWWAGGDASVSAPRRTRLGTVAVSALIGAAVVAGAASAARPRSTTAPESTTATLAQRTAPAVVVDELPLIEHPIRVAERWRFAQQNMDRSAYQALLDAGFSTATPRGRVGAQAWTTQRFAQLAHDVNYDAEVLDVHPAGINWPDDPEAVEVEIAETWLADIPMRGRARITLVHGRIVEEAHWAAEPATPSSTPH